MRQSVKDSNSDMRHESGGAWGLDVNGNEVACHALPGASVNISDGSSEIVTATIRPLFVRADCPIVTLQGTWHDHPGRRQREDPTKPLFVQQASDDDLAGASPGKNYAIGIASQLVYPYDSTTRYRPISMAKFGL